MEKNAKGLLPKVEIVIVVVFALSFLVWIVPKCGRDRPMDDPEQEELLEADSSQIKGGSPKPGPAVAAARDTTVKAPAPATPPPAAGAAKPEQQYSRLYVTIDGLNLRSTPGLKSGVLAKLVLFEEVYFLNEVTDSTTEVSLGYEKAKEPWVKVRTRKGQEGWVFGAGVSYYKKKRPGTLE
ncbi:MAG: SH3 domain-containing protein [Saprospirales bacterium]|nr:SH3 domain-containing protein [Saprospirales bacterium]